MLPSKRRKISSPSMENTIMWTNSDDSNSILESSINSQVAPQNPFQLSKAKPVERPTREALRRRSEIYEDLKPFKIRKVLSATEIREASSDVPELRECMSWMNFGTTNDIDTKAVKSEDRQNTTGSTIPVTCVELYPHRRLTNYYQSPQPATEYQSREAEHPRDKLEKKPDAQPKEAEPPRIIPAQNSEMRLIRNSYFS